jgi:hypothetical protein
MNEYIDPRSRLQPDGRPEGTPNSPMSAAADHFLLTPVLQVHDLQAHFQMNYFGVQSGGEGRGRRDLRPSAQRDLRPRRGIQLGQDDAGQDHCRGC